jgi:hypothetical protein
MFFACECDVTKMCESHQTILKSAQETNSLIQWQRLQDLRVFLFPNGIPMHPFGSIDPRFFITQKLI